MESVRIVRTAGSLGPLPENPFPVADFLARPLVARVATGIRHVRPVWFLWEEETFWVFSGPWSTLPRRLADEPRFELVVDTCEFDSGITQQVIARGLGTTAPFDRARGRRKLVRYLGGDESRWDKRFTLDGAAEAGAVWVKLVPDTLLVNDLSFAPSSHGSAPDGAHG